MKASSEQKLEPTRPINELKLGTLAAMKAAIHTVTARSMCRCCCGACLCSARFSSTSHTGTIMTGGVIHIHSIHDSVRSDKTLMFAANSAYAEYRIDALSNKRCYMSHIH
eukprot:9502-Heterococcus_DN1.PRE.2